MDSNTPFDGTDDTDRPNDDNQESRDDSADSSNDAGEDDQEESKRYDPSTNPKVYPKSLTSLTQADAATKRLTERFDWIKSRLGEIKRLDSETQETTERQALHDEYDRLAAEVKSLKAKRPELATKRLALKEEADRAIENHQFADIDWD